MASPAGPWPLTVCPISSGVFAVRKIPHIEVRWLWLHEQVRKGWVVLEKVSGKWNPGDVMTKHLGILVVEERLRAMGLVK